MRRSAFVFALSLAAMTWAGCATTRIRLEEPVGAKLFVAERGREKRGREYEFPATIEVRASERYSNVNDAGGGKPVRMTLPDGTALRGYLHAYDAELTPTEELAPNTFALTPEQIDKLKSGHVVTVIGYSAVRRRPVYKLILGLNE